MKDKKHKKKKQKFELEEEIYKKKDSVDEDLQNGTKKIKKKKKRDRGESVDRHNGREASSMENEPIIKKKKKKRKRNDSECVDGAEDMSGIVSEPGHKVKKKKKRESEVSPLETKDICEIEELQTKKKLKKKKRQKSISPPVVESDAQIEHSEEVPKVKKKKKHKKNKDEENPNDVQIDESNQTGNMKLKEKKNKKSTEENDTICRNDNNKIKSSNDNLPVNGATLGQWSTASFEDKQRTDKFHRLLGGMKKDVTKKPKGKLFGGLVERSGGNNALDKEGQEQLNKNLQAQYDSALSMRLGSVKGIGFGFTPPPGEGKKFYIDTGKSSSMKFND